MREIYLSKVFGEEFGMEDHSDQVDEDLAEFVMEEVDVALYHYGHAVLADTTLHLVY